MTEWILGTEASAEDRATLAKAASRLHSEMDKAGFWWDGKRYTHRAFPNIGLVPVVEVSKVIDQ